MPAERADGLDFIWRCLAEVPVTPRSEQFGSFPQAFSHLALISAAINLDYQLDHGTGMVRPALARAR